MLLTRRLKVIVTLVILSTPLFPRLACSQDSSTPDSRVESELAAMGKRGAVIARARDQVLTILQEENACTAWFRQADPDPAGVFQSLHYEIGSGKPAYIFRMADGRGEQFYKQPWAARTTENGGPNSTVELNANGPFFNYISPVMEVRPGGIPVRPAGLQRLAIASFRGETNEAQMTALLHELGHIIGRLPEDDDSWDGRSSRNTAEVLRHCKDEIRRKAKGSSRRTD